MTDKNQAALADLRQQASDFLDHTIDQGWVDEDCGSDGIALLKDAIKNADLALQSLTAPSAGVDVSPWKYCPECGLEPFTLTGFDNGRWCNSCKQEWFPDIDYSDCVQTKLQRLHLTAIPDMREAPIPEKWGVSGPDFNQWNEDAAKFVRIVQDNPNFWWMDHGVKYLNIRIDTRDGHFIMFGDPQPNEFKETRERIGPDRVLKAIREHREHFPDKITKG